MTDFVYDVESLPNIFTCCARNHTTGRRFRFEISQRRNDYAEIVDWMHRLSLGGHRMVGFNNVHYDYPMIHHLVKNLGHLDKYKKLTAALKAKSDQIFEDGDAGNKFAHTLWPNQCMVEQLDLFKIHHFDNLSKATSLKRLQFNMRLRKIQEFEMSFTENLKKKKIPKLLNYNDWDVDSTGSFLDMTQDQIAFREDMCRRYEQDFMNSNDTKIGEQYLTMQLKENVGIGVLKDEDGNKRGTPRDVMPLKDFIFDSIKFDCPEFQAVLDRMMKLKMFCVATKFHWNENDDYRDGMVEAKAARAQYTKVKKDFKEGISTQDMVDMHQVDSKAITEKYRDHKITCKVDGMEFVFGKGGLHGSLKKHYSETTDTHVIVDIDVTSYYPSIGIENNLYPHHLTEEFCPIYREIRSMRTQHAKGTTENAMLKLALNGSYGKTNSKYSVFYDPLYMVTTTINGQLLLCMLWEKLAQIDDVQILQANTDGITIRMPRTKSANKAVSKVCKKWQKKTKLRLEQAIYTRMWIRDGNNYIAEYTSGKLKSKGAYVYDQLFHRKGQDTSHLDQWHKNHSMLIVQKAAEAELVHGISAKKFIQEHKDLYDFFLCTNIAKTHTLVLEDKLWNTDTEYQRVSRYLVVNRAGSDMYKIMPPLKGNTEVRRNSINKGYQVQIYNNVKSEDPEDYDINYDFYIDEANKLIAPFK